MSIYRYMRESVDHITCLANHVLVVLGTSILNSNAKKAANNIYYKPVCTIFIKRMPYDGLCHTGFDQCLGSNLYMDLMLFVSVYNPHG